MDQTIKEVDYKDLENLKMQAIKAGVMQDTYKISSNGMKSLTNIKNDIQQHYSHVVNIRINRGGELAMLGDNVLQYE